MSILAQTEHKRNEIVEKVKSFFENYPKPEDVKYLFKHSIDEEPIGFIYIIRNKMSGRVYVGQTVGGISVSSGSFRRYPTGWIQTHWQNKDVKNDLMNFGWSSFDDIKIMAVCYSEEQLNYLEGYYMKKYDSILNGYNVQLPNDISYHHGTGRKYR